VTGARYAIPVESEGSNVRFACFALITAGVVALSASTASAQTDPSGYATQAHTPQGFRLPEGSGCSGDVARWQAIQDNDYHGGNIGLPVYHAIQREIAQAAAACSAGHDAQATAMIHASRARHGYPQ
jgi:hypothetical protein